MIPEWSALAFDRHSRVAIVLRALCIGKALPRLNILKVDRYQYIPRV